MSVQLRVDTNFEFGGRLEVESKINAPSLWTRAPRTDAPLRQVPSWTTPL